MAHHHAIKPGYRKLVARLNKVPQGATPSEALFRILAMLFSEKEAGLVALLPVKPFKAEAAAKAWRMDLVSARNILEELASRAILVDIDQDGESVYALPPRWPAFLNSP